MAARMCDQPIHKRVMILGNTRLLLLNVSLNLACVRSSLILNKARCDSIVHKPSQPRCAPSICALTNGLRKRLPYATRAAMLMPDGIVVAGHGSRDPDGVREFEALVALIRMRASKRIVRHGYLEFALPTIDVAVRDALHAGA